MVEGIELSQEQIEQAEAVVAALKDSYLQWVRQDLANLIKLWEQASQTGHHDRSGMMADMFRIAHDIKGQGGSFGFDLVSQVGEQLCRLLETHSDWNDVSLGVVKSHVDVILSIIVEGRTGTGSEEDQAVMQRLNSLIKAL